jgi:formylglycine-generating enzyme required for sulfatase activity
VTLDPERAELVMRLVYVPPGGFMMGEDHPYMDRSKPVHGVEITRGFYIGKFEVTAAQYERLVDDGRYRPTAPGLPATRVTWGEAVAFCEKLSELTGRRFRLPTEAEWEYACRAGTNTRYHCGNHWSLLEKVAWYDRSSFGRLHPVGGLWPNAFDLHDMHGNVAEWCSDWLADDWYERSHRRDPAGPPSGEWRVIRGGGYASDMRVCHSASRIPGRPDAAYEWVGFRVVMEEGPEAASPGAGATGEGNAGQGRPRGPASR